jgi:cytochrome b561
MPLSSPKASAPRGREYGWISITLHWLGVAGLLTAFITGQMTEDLPRTALRAALDNHIFWATLMAAPILARVVWRALRGFAPVGEQAFALTLIQKLVMWGLLLSLLVAVGSGLLAVWSGGRAIELGFISLPSPLSANRGLHEIMEEVHEVAVHAWIPLLALHVLGALKHLLIDRDGRFFAIFRPAK